MKDKTKKELKDFGNNLLNNLPNITVSVFIMFTSIAIFGSQIAVLGVLLLFFQIMYSQTSFSKMKFVKSSVLMLFVGIFAGLSQLNMPLLIILNFVMPFVIIMLCSDDYNSKGYLVYGLLFLLLQTSKISSLADIGTVVLALIYGLTILYIYNYLGSKIKKNEPEKRIIATAYESAVKRLKILSKKRLEENTPNPLNSLLAKVNNLLYMEVAKKAEVLGQKEECYFQSVLLLKRIDKLTSLAYEKRESLTEADYQYFYKVAKLFQFVKEQYTVESLEEIIKMLDTFITNNSLSDSSMTYDWNYTIKKLKYILKKAQEPKENISIKEYVHLRIQKLKNNFNLDTVQMRFAIKTSLVVGIGTILEHFVMVETGFANAYWIPITSYTLMMQFHEDQKKKMKNYIIGSVIGTFVFTLIFQYVPQSATLIFMIIAYAIMFSVKNDIAKAVIGGQLVLVMSYPIYGKLEVMIVRIILVLFAALIAWFIDKFVLYTDNLHGLINKVNHMLRVDRSILKELKRAINTKNAKFNYISELLLESCLLESLIIKHEKEQQYYTDPYLAKSVIQYHRNFILSSEQLINIFKTKDKDEIEHSKEYLKYIEEMDYILNITQNNWESIYNDSKKAKKLDKRPPRQITEDTPYLTKHMMLCIKNIEKIYHALDEDRKRIQK